MKADIKIHDESFILILEPEEGEEALMSTFATMLSSERYGMPWAIESLGIEYMKPYVRFTVRDQRAR